MNTETEQVITQYLKTQFENIPWLYAIEQLPLIGVGGSFRNIGEISRKNNILSTTISDNYPMEAKEVLNIYALVKTKDLNQRKKIKGLSKDRADIFLGAYSIISSFINFTGTSEAIISSYGVRHGIIQEILQSQKLF